MCKEIHKQISQDCRHHFCGYCTLQGEVYGSDIEFNQECVLCEHRVWEDNHCYYEQNDYCPDYELKK